MEYEELSKLEEEAILNCVNWVYGESLINLNSSLSEQAQKIYTERKDNILPLIEKFEKEEYKLVWKKV